MDTTSLTSATRTTIGGLQRLDRAQGVNQVELASGRRDTRLAVFAQISSFSLSDRASDLATTKNDITSALSTVKAASAGLDAIGQTLDQARAIADQYERSGDADERARLQQSFDEISRQIDSLAADSGIGGVNLIAGQGGG
ncbi:hypothetical protein CKO38_10780, partial [Rhodospirillum rubrum]|nr:hypothetical protein [Rhodospirillum rubrum]